jgi:predicted nucleic acid-binding Zn ribbon protein
MRRRSLRHAPQPVLESQIPSAPVAQPSGCAAISEKRARHAIKKISEFIGPALRRATAQRSSFAWLAGTWPAIVGKQLAAHTRPSHIANGVLEIAVTNKEWRTQLESVAAEFRARVNEAWGSSVIREVRFSDERKSGPRLRHELDNNYTPFVRARKTIARPRTPAGPDGANDR